MLVRTRRAVGNRRACLIVQLTAAKAAIAHGGSPNDRGGRDAGPRKGMWRHRRPWRGGRGRQSAGAAPACRAAQPRVGQAQAPPQRVPAGSACRPDAGRGAQHGHRRARRNRRAASLRERSESTAGETRQRCYFAGTYGCSPKVAIAVLQQGRRCRSEFRRSPEEGVHADRSACHAPIKSRQTSLTGDERHNKRKSGPQADSLKESQLAAGRDLLFGIGRRRRPRSQQQASKRAPRGSCGPPRCSVAATPEMRDAVRASRRPRGRRGARRRRPRRACARRACSARAGRGGLRSSG
jgi:hypothetical protein